jgi:hypothetical protein
LCTAVCLYRLRDGSYFILYLTFLYILVAYIHRSLDCEYSMDGVDMNDCGCVYSPAKRRGPIPGKAMGPSSSRKDESTTPTWQQQPAQQQQQPQQHQAVPSMVSSSLLAQQLLQVQPMAAALATNNQASNFMFYPSNLPVLLETNNNLNTMDLDVSQPNTNLGISMDGGAIPRTITQHTQLLEPSNADGTRLYCYYRLSVDEIFRLPATLTSSHDEEETTIGPHVAARSAAQFAELALGALVHNEVAWAMELCNAVVHCLRESVVEIDAIVPAAVQFAIAKAYFLLGVFRAYRGDMPRYFKYRRVCMAYLSKMEVRVQCLIFE